MAIFAAAALAARLHVDQALVYDRYKSGRPRRVVGIVANDEDEGEVRLLRLPDRDNGEARIVARDALEFAPVSVEFVRLIDARDVQVDLKTKHGSAVVYRVRGDRLVGIVETNGPHIVDLDGDGVPEIINAAYEGMSECGVRIFVELLRWNGSAYDDDGHRYVTFLHGDDAQVELSASKRYVLRVYGGRAAVQLDGESLAPGKPFTTEEGCHDLVARGGGWALLEELP
jgi:hypothetical protein